jgi:hypothetical protein
MKDQVAHQSHYALGVVELLKGKGRETEFRRHAFPKEDLGNEAADSVHGVASESRIRHRLNGRGLNPAAMKRDAIHDVERCIMKAV